VSSAERSKINKNYKVVINLTLERQLN